jgi:hypothetical protein
MGSVGKRDWCAKDPIPKIKTTGGEKFFHTDVHLDSPGGDVMTALAIGNLMYENALTAFVKEDANCSSACVHILASSPQRVILGQVNIHRQYSNSTDTSYAKISSNFTKIERIAISQFTQAGVSPELWDAMMRVPPQTAKRLSLEEIMRFRLMGTSPALEDALNSCMAKRLGITKQEYLQREAIYDGIKYCNKRAGLEQ